MEKASNIKIRPLFFYDKEAVIELEEAWEKESGFISGLSDMLPEDEEEDKIVTMENAYGYGLFDGDTLVSMCSVGYADGVCCQDVEYEDLLLSDVYTRKEYRGHGYASQLIKKVVNIYKDVNIFLDIMEDNLEIFYNKIGFQMVMAEFGLMKKEKIKRIA